MEINRLNERLKEVEESLKIIQKKWIDAYEEILRLIDETRTEKE